MKWLCQKCDIISEDEKICFSCGEKSLGISNFDYQQQIKLQMMLTSAMWVKYTDEVHPEFEDVEFIKEADHG